MPKDHDQKHTPTPWRITKCIDDKFGDFYIRGIAEGGADTPLLVSRAGPEKENMEFILLAVNNHEKLLSSVLGCLEDLRHYARTHGPGPDQRLAKLEETIANIIDP